MALQCWLRSRREGIPRLEMKWMKTPLLPYQTKKDNSGETAWYDLVKWASEADWGAAIVASRRRTRFQRFWVHIREAFRCLTRA